MKRNVVLTGRVVQCSVQCGNGTQYRTVYCALTDGNVVNIRPAVDCYNKPRMTEKQQCIATDCPMIWFAGAFGEVQATWICLHVFCQKLKMP